MPAQVKGRTEAHYDQNVLRRAELHFVDTN